nr:hypothetical protein HK105_001519 [Polyrhizophydium stewartii]
MSLLSLPLPGARLPPGHVKIGSVGGHAIAGTSHPVAFRLLDAQAGSQAIVSPAHVAALTPQGTAAGTSASTPLGSKPAGWIDTASELDAHDSLAPASGRGSKTSSSTDAHERTLALPGEHLQPLSTKEIQRIVSDMLEGGSSVCIVVKQPSPNTATSRLHVPLPVAYQSGTIQHIHKCAGRFAEGRRGIEFPTIEAETMGQIIDFLNRQYLAQHWQEAKHFCTQDAASVRAPPQFEPRLETVLDVMYAGLYLDIPDLVDVCAIKAARNFSRE